MLVSLSEGKRVQGVASGRVDGELGYGLDGQASWRAFGGPEGVGAAWSAARGWEGRLSSCFAAVERPSEGGVESGRVGERMGKSWGIKLFGEPPEGGEVLAGRKAAGGR